MLKKFTIKKNQTALLLKEGEVKKVLTAGEHYLWSGNLCLGKTEVVIYDHAQPEVKGELANYLRDYLPELVEQHFININFAEDEIGLRYERNELVEIIANNRDYLYCRQALNQRIEKVKLAQGYLLPESLAEALIQAVSAKRTIIGQERIILTPVLAGYVGLVKFEGKVVDILSIGIHCFWKLSSQIQVELCQIDNQPLKKNLADSLMTYSRSLVDQHCITMALNEQQVGLRYENDVLVEILPPGSVALYWHGTVEQRLEIVSLADHFQVQQTVIDQLIQPQLRKQRIIGEEGILLAVIPAYHLGVLKVDGKIETLLQAGTTGYWCFNRTVNLEVIDTRLQSLEVSGQEILTKDKVNLRINLIANWRYSDILLAHSEIANPTGHLYRELQFALREAVGTRTLDELLENKQLIDEVVNQYIGQKLQDYGLEVSGMGVKDIILPGDMKTILAQVVEAEKSAQANVIRRREETAATRSLLNTAKVMENNPVALRLKEMETLERVAERIDRISVVGGLDQVLNGLVKLQVN